MPSLLRPTRFRFQCTDMSGRCAETMVSASFDSAIGRWIWHASFRNAVATREQLLGTSHSLDEVRGDVCRRIEELLFARRPSVLPVEGRKLHPSKVCVLEGPFEYPGGRPGWYRAERKSDGTIWTVEIVNDEGECFDSIELPMRWAHHTATTEQKALDVIAQLLQDTYGARGVT